MNYRKISDDILNDWFVFSKDTVLAYTDSEDRKHTIEFGEISELIQKIFLNKIVNLFKNN